MNKPLKQNDYFKSSDLALACALSCYGYEIEKITQDNSRKATFSIKSDEKLDDLIQKYWTHQLKVEPLSFFNFLKEIKTRIYNI